MALSIQSPQAALPPDVDYYTCTMHPSVHSHDPHGKCPICGMDLVPVKKSSAVLNQSAASTNNMSAMDPGAAKDSEETPAEFSVSVKRQQQIGVTYAAVERRPFTHTVRAVGVVSPNCAEKSSSSSLKSGRKIA